MLPITVSFILVVKVNIVALEVKGFTYEALQVTGRNHRAKINIILVVLQVYLKVQFQALFSSAFKSAIFLS